MALSEKSNLLGLKVFAAKTQADKCEITHLYNDCPYCVCCFVPLDTKYSTMQCGEGCRLLVLSVIALFVYGNYTNISLSGITVVVYFS